MSMLEWAAGLVPLAQGLSPRQLQKTFQDYTADAGERTMPTLIFVGVLVLSIILIWLIVLRHREKNRPYLLFYELSVLHTVGRATERRLIHLARTHRLGDPALLFVCPDLVSELKALEASEARTEKERRRVEDFFESFTKKVFG